MSHWGYVIEQLTHADDREREHWLWRRRAAVRRQAERRATTTAVTCARAADGERLPQGRGTTGAPA